MTPAQISVVIPALDAESFIGSQLEAVCAQRSAPLFEVVVADNGSSDRTRDVVRGWSQADARVRLIDAADAPRGGAGAKNRGVAAAEASLIAFADADDVVGDGWLSKLYEGLLVADVVAVTREYWTLNPELRGPMFPKSRGLGQFCGVPVVSGGAFGIRKAIYEDLGGFDEGFEGAVDTDFSLRLYARYRSAPLFVSDAVVHCRSPVAPSARFRRARRLARSRTNLKEKHRDTIRLGSSPRRRTSARTWLAHASKTRHLMTRQGLVRGAQELGARFGALEGKIRLARAKRRRWPSPKSG